MSRPAGATGARLYCGRCDNEVPADADQCGAIFGPKGGRGAKKHVGTPCGSKAFYRGRRPVRHIMGASLDDVPDEQPGPELRQARGRFRRFVMTNGKPGRGLR